MADTFEYQCSRCNESLTLPIALLGQQGKCPSCQNVEVLQDASIQQSPLPQPATTAASSSPFRGDPVTAEAVQAATNPFAMPKQQAFPFGMVNPGHRDRLGTTLWGVIICFILATIWAIVIIASPIIGMVRDNPEIFNGPNGIEDETEFLFLLAEQTSDFQRSDVEGLSAEEAQSTAVLALLQGVGPQAIGCLLLWLTGAICYLVFFHTLWAQIQDDPTVRFSPAVIVALHFVPVGIGIVGGMLATVSPAIILLANFASLIAWYVILFITYWKLADHMEKYHQRQGIAGHQVSSGLALAFCIMQVAAIIPFLGGLVALAGFVVWFIVVFQLKNSANDIINHKMKLEQTGNPPVRSHFEIQN